MVSLLHISTLDEEAKNVFGLLRTIKKLSLQRNDFELNIIHEYYSEAHENYAKEVKLIFTGYNFKSEIKKDIYGKERIISAG